MSSTRSRRPGRASGRRSRRKNRSSRNAPLSTRLAEILVRRGEDAHVDVDHVLAADARDLAGLQRAQHLGLRGEVHVADLVEEERAAVRLLEEAAALAPARR